MPEIRAFLAIDLDEDLKPKINKIIKSIDMPRGTFYLYFENKEDIYSYIFEDYVKTLDNVFIKNLKASNGNIFDMYKDVVSPSIVIFKANITSFISSFLILLIN